MSNNKKSKENLKKKENKKENINEEDIPNHKVEFVHIPGKQLLDTLDSFDNFNDIDLGSMNEQDIEKIMKK